MAAKSDPTKPLQPLDLVFSCNVCHDSIRDICSPLQDEKGLDGTQKPVAKLWMTECAHLICAKHLAGGAPPFHPAGQAPRAVCPVCVGRQNNHALKQMYAISGFTKGEYDPDIPHHFFQCPPVALDTKDGGMDALRFQFLGLVTYGIAIATKFRSLQTAHSRLKDQTETLKLEKTEAETEVHALTERITLMEEAERKYKEKQPEIKHYLQQFTLVKKELDRRNEDLAALGYPPPPIDYTYPPSRLYEDDTSNEELSGYMDRTALDPINVEENIPSVSSITLRGDPSRNYTDDDSQRDGTKRQRLSQYHYKPQKPQSPHKDQAFQSRPGIRPPPPSKSNHFQPPPALRQSENCQDIAGERGETRTSPLVTNVQREDWDTWGRDEVNVHPGWSNRTPYMSGALPDDTGFRPSSLPKRKIQPVDNIEDISRFDHVGGYNNTRTFRDTQGQHGIYHAETQYYLPTRGPGRDSRQNQAFSQPPGNVPSRTHQLPYRGTETRREPIPASRQPNRPHTPSPQRLNTLRQSDGASVTSPFFRADQTQSSRYCPSSTPMAAPTAYRTVPEFRMAPPRRPVQISRPQPQTMNGLSFVQNPHLGSHNFEMAFNHEHGAPRDPHGFFVRPGTHQSPAPRYDTARSRQPSRPQPLPSSTPSLASSFALAHPRRPRHDSALANMRGIKGGSTSSRGTATELFGSRPSMFSSSRRSIRR